MALGLGSDAIWEAHFDTKLCLIFMILFQEEQISMVGEISPFQNLYVSHVCNSNSLYKTSSSTLKHALALIQFVRSRACMNKFLHIGTIRYIHNPGENGPVSRQTSN